MGAHSGHVLTYEQELLTLKLGQTINIGMEHGAFDILG